MWDSHFKKFVFIWCVNYLIVLHIIVGIVLLYRFFFNKNFVLKINKDVFKNKCFCKIQSIRVNLFNGGICLNLILIHSELGMGHNSVVVSAHSVMCRGVDPTWWIHWVISHSSQLLTAGVTKAVGCVILSQTQCLLEVEVTTSEMYFSYSFSTTWLKSRPKSNVSLNEHDQKYVGPTPRRRIGFQSTVPWNFGWALTWGMASTNTFWTWSLTNVKSKWTTCWSPIAPLCQDTKWQCPMTWKRLELNHCPSCSWPWWTSRQGRCRCLGRWSRLHNNDLLGEMFAGNWNSHLTVPRRIWVVVGCNHKLPIPKGNVTNPVPDRARVLHS